MIGLRLTPLQQQQMMQEYVRQQIVAGGNPQTVPMPGTRTLGGDLAQGSTWDEPTYVEGQGWETSGDFQRSYPGRGSDTEVGDYGISAQTPAGLDPGMDALNPMLKGSEAWQQGRDAGPFLPQFEDPRAIKPISDVRVMPDQPLSTIMTPQEEQQAMQDYVRQRLIQQQLAAQQQPAGVPMGMSSQPPGGVPMGMPGPGGGPSPPPGAPSQGYLEYQKNRRYIEDASDETDTGSYRGGGGAPPTPTRDAVLNTRRIIRAGGT